MTQSIGKKALLFVNKKKQKNFDFLVGAPAVPHRKIKVFFASFLFTKKKTLPFATMRPVRWAFL
jgi:hypothetical protein